MSDFGTLDLDIPPISIDYSPCPNKIDLYAYDLLLDTIYVYEQQYHITFTSPNE